MGVVYHTWDDELGVAVALKVIRAEVMADPHASHDVERRFKRELVLARQVTHKNVVRIHDLGDVNGTKSDGQRPNTSRCRSSTDVTSPDPAGVGRDSDPAGAASCQTDCRRAPAAHEAGVVHRDLKPENIMVDAEDQTLITVIGISRRYRDNRLVLPLEKCIAGARVRSGQDVDVRGDLLGGDDDVKKRHRRHESDQ